MIANITALVRFNRVNKKQGRTLISAHRDHLVTQIVALLAVNNFDALLVLWFLLGTNCMPLVLVKL